MRHLKNLLLASTLITSIAGFSDFDSPSPMAPSAPSYAMNNRPLIRINGKTLSLMDVIKKMNIIIHQHVPHIRNSPVELFKFYMSQWKPTIDDMIFNELTIADAEEKDIKISDGDVREEMERRFGPNIITTLNKLNLQYDEARKMIHDELLVRQLQGMKIYSKAQMSITPEMIKKEYLAFLQSNPPEEKWEYQVLSVRGKDESLCKTFIENISADLRLESTKLADLPEKFKENPQITNNSVSMTLSKEYSVMDKNLSKEHKDILKTLNTDSFSEPIEQFSRTSNSNVYRIFYLKNHTVKNAPSFDDKYDEIENKLLGEAVQKEREAYKNKLFEKFGITKDYLNSEMPEDYKPFTFR